MNQRRFAHVISNGEEVKQFSEALARQYGKNWYSRLKLLFTLIERSWTHVGSGTSIPFSAAVCLFFGMDEKGDWEVVGGKEQGLQYARSIIRIILRRELSPFTASRKEYIDELFEKMGWRMRVNSQWFPLTIDRYLETLQTNARSEIVNMVEMTEKKDEAAVGSRHAFANGLDLSQYAKTEITQRRYLDDAILLYSCFRQIAQVRGELELLKKPTKGVEGFVGTAQKITPIVKDVTEMDKTRIKQARDILKDLGVLRQKGDRSAARYYVRWDGSFSKIPITPLPRLRAVLVGEELVDETEPATVSEIREKSPSSAASVVQAVLTRALERVQTRFDTDEPLARQVAKARKVLEGVGAVLDGMELIENESFDEDE